MKLTLARITDFASPAVDRIDLSEQRIAVPLCDDPADLAHWIALPVALSILLWGGLLHIMFI